MFVYKYYPVGHKGLWRSGFWYLRESWNQFPMTIVPRKNDLKLAMVSILFSPRPLSSTLRNSCWPHGSNPWPGPISSTLNQSLGSGPKEPSSARVWAGYFPVVSVSTGTPPLSVQHNTAGPHVPTFLPSPQPPAVSTSHTPQSLSTLSSYLDSCSLVFWFKAWKIFPFLSCCPCLAHTSSFYSIRPMHLFLLRIYLPVVPLAMGSCSPQPSALSRACPALGNICWFCWKTKPVCLCLVNLVVSDSLRPHGL